MAARQGTEKCWVCRRTITARKAAKKRADLERTAPGHHTRAQWFAQIEKQQGYCFYCAADMMSSTGCFEGHKEHRVPLSRGGSKDIENIVAACHRCNFEKHDQTDEEFQDSLLAKWREKSEVSTVPSSIGSAAPSILDGFSHHFRHKVLRQAPIQPIAPRHPDPEEESAFAQSVENAIQNTKAMEPIERPDSWYSERRLKLAQQAVEACRRKPSASEPATDKEQSA